MSDQWITDSYALRWRCARPEVLGYIIRYAEMSDNPELLPSWVEQTVRVPKLSVSERWQRMQDCITLLLETYADMLNPVHWRSTCLDFLHSLLAEVDSLAGMAKQQEQQKKLLWEIQVTGFYFDPCAKRGV
ncbi:hypothetical protein [Endozoicomonas elysicola]|uniref:Uncharacterized protein n=1 Tax=Endozoicomonas elysicola TaxID=305900 RepID=A0A081K9Z5_9GAMM|nr:hypothetical protein [Endozoicomonas elysicola]KEI70971.1 hypothetical protein GV64_09655 [Endozoicomonas elysicola]